MLRFVLFRLMQMMFIMTGLSMVVFLIFFATPGIDPAANIAGRGASAEVLAAVRESFGLDRPLPIQYLSMMKRMLIDQDLTSFSNRSYQVLPAILNSLPVTFSVAFGTAVIWVSVSIAFGTAAALTRGKVIDKLLMTIGLIGISMPVFWVASVANLFTQHRYQDSWLLSWVPPLGYVPLSEDPGSWALHLIIPWITGSILYIGLYSRLLRSSLVEVYHEDFIRTARAKGLSETRILFRHALRTAMLPFVSLLGLDLGALIAGNTLIVELLFGLPGLGMLTFRALQSLDLPFMMTTIMYGSFFVVLLNTLVDLLYAFLDPRVKDARRN